MRRVTELALGVGIVALMFWRGIGAGVALLVATLLAYGLIIVVAPFYRRATVRVAERPIVVPIGDEPGDIPDTVREQLAHDRAALVALGFTPRGLIYRPPVSLPAAYLALYHHLTARAAALSQVWMTPGQSATKLRTSGLEFATMYDDGARVELSNSGTYNPGLEYLPGFFGQLPQVRDVPTLWMYYLRLVEKYETQTSRSASSRLPPAADATATTAYHDELQRVCALHKRLGLLQETGTPGVLQPTWRLSVKMGIASRSPGREFYRRRVRARAERLRRELDGDVSLTRSERIGRRVGWILLCGGLVSGAVATLMAPTAALVAAAGMVMAWSWVMSRKREPGWRALIVGGVTATLLFSVAALDLVFPMLLLTVSSVLVLEGFRAAAT